MEIASLALKVDSTDITEAERELGKLTGSGQKTEKATDGLTRSSKKLSQQTKKTTGNVRMMKGGVQQLGFQIQDVAVQAQMGTNAMVILGQQGPQILSIFGPGGAIAGAIIAIGAAVGGTLISSLIESKSATDQLEESLSLLDGTARLTKEGVFELTNQLERLATTNKLAAELEARAGIVGAIEAIAASATLAKEKLGDFLSPGFLQNADGLSAVFASLEKNQRNAAEVVNAFHKDSSRFNSIIIEDARNSSASIDSIRSGYAQLGVVVSNLETKYKASRSEAVALAGAFSQITKKSDINQLRTLQSALDAIADNDGASDKVIKLASEVRKFTSEADKAGIKAEGLAEFISNIGKDAGLSNVNDGLTGTVSQFERLEERLKEQVALYGVVSREAQLRYKIENGQIEGLKEGQADILIGYARELDAKKKLTEQEKALDLERTAASRERAKEQAKALRLKEKNSNQFSRLLESLRTEEEAIEASYERRLDIILSNTKEGSQKQNDLKARLSEQFDKAILGEFSQPDTIGEEIGRLEELHSVKLESIRRQYGEQSELELELTREKNQQIAILESEKNQILLGNAEEAFAGLSGLAKTFGGEQSKAYQALFATSQAFSIAKATMNMYTGISEGVKLGWPAMIPAIALAAGQGASAISSIRSQSFSGAYDEGGVIPSGSVGLVGEIGPELVRGPATVTSRRDTAALLEKNADKSSGEGNVTVINLMDQSKLKGLIAQEMAKNNKVIVNAMNEEQRSRRF